MVMYGQFARASRTTLPVGGPVEKTFTWRGRTLAYEESGAGARVVVLAHGLLLDAHSNRHTARCLAKAGFRVLSVDLLGHGRSDHPVHASEYRMDVYAEQVVALLDHVGVSSAALLGTSLGANVSLFVAARYPERVQGLVVEMPVLEWAIPAAALAFIPLLLAVHYGGPVLRVLGAVARRVPSGIGFVDGVLGPIRTDPDANAAVLHGVLVGPVAPTIEERRGITAPALVFAHRADLIHPFHDAENLVEVLPNARLIRAAVPLSVQARRGGLLAEVEAFLAGCWRKPAPKSP